MPPRDGFSVTQFITVANIDRSENRIRDCQWSLPGGLSVLSVLCDPKFLTTEDPTMLWLVDFDRRIRLDIFLAITAIIRNRSRAKVDIVTHDSRLP
jgi:hypothetical protein